MGLPLFDENGQQRAVGTPQPERPTVVAMSIDEEDLEEAYLVEDDAP